MTSEHTPLLASNTNSGPAPGTTTTAATANAATTIATTTSPRNGDVLKFLRYGEANTFAPCTSLVLIYDVFRGSTVGAFCNYVQQAQDIVLKDVVDPEVIFDHLQSKNEELLLADCRVFTTKRHSAFHLGEARTFAETDQKPNPKRPATSYGNPKIGGDSNTNEKQEYVGVFFIFELKNSSIFPSMIFLRAFSILRRYWFGQDIRDIYPVVLGPPETASTPDGQAS